MRREGDTRGPHPGALEFRWRIAASYMISGAVVLCGGKSTRMGTSKALLPFDQILPDLPPAVIVTRDESEGRGPLEGLRAGLKALPARVERAYVTSCDVPLLVPDFIRQMLDLADGYDIAVIEVNGFSHPLSAVYGRATLPSVEDLLARNRLRPAFLFDVVKTRRIEPAEMTADPDLRTLRNLNTREDYELALAAAGF